MLPCLFQWHSSSVFLPISGSFDRFLMSTDLLDMEPVKYPLCSSSVSKCPTAAIFDPSRHCLPSSRGYSSKNFRRAVLGETLADRLLFRPFQLRLLVSSPADQTPVDLGQPTERSKLTIRLRVRQRATIHRLCIR